MVNKMQQKEDLGTFRERFESLRVGLSIAASPESVSCVFSAINITGMCPFLQPDYLANVLVAKNFIVDLVRILALQNQPDIRSVISQNNHENHLANLFSIGSSISTESFDIKLAIPLIQQVVNNAPQEKIHSAVFRLAAQARLLLTSPTPSLKVASDAQSPVSSQVTQSSSPLSHDEAELRALKRIKLAHGISRCEKECIGIGPREDMETSNRDDCSEEATIEKSSIFQYRPLNTARREIRLLVLHPSENILDPFSYSCTLTHVSKDEDPSYEALSYVWGSEANRQNVLIDGRHLSATANLAEALDHLYYGDRPRRLWVDAICINQNDIPERNQQVQNMTEIYARARNVVVWIGVLEMMTQKFLDRLENEDNDRSPEHLRGFTARGSRIKGDPSAFDEEDKRLLSELAENPWFRRVWVIQEVAVAREVIVQTGRTTIFWSAFGQA